MRHKCDDMTAAGLSKSIKNLLLIEENLHKYQNEERQAPSTEVLEEVRRFLESFGDEKIDEPALFVSLNGHIVLTIGSRPKTLNIRFSPKVTFVLKRPGHEVLKGEGLELAVKHTLENFTILEGNQNERQT